MGWVGLQASDVTSHRDGAALAGGRVAGGSLYREKPVFKTNIAFTLIELLLVIAIMSLLMALLFPALKAAREKGRSALCVNNLRQHYFAINSYSDDYDSYVVPWYDGVKTWQQILVNKGYLPFNPNFTNYLKKEFKCPSNHNGYFPSYENASSIYYNGTPNYMYPTAVGGAFGVPLLRMGAVGDPSSKAMLMEGGAVPAWGTAFECDYEISPVSTAFDPANSAYHLFFPHNGRMNILYWDGHAASSSTSDPNLNVNLVTLP